MWISVVANHGLNGTAEVVIIAGSKGKERFRRPLRKGSNPSRLRHISFEPRSPSPFASHVPSPLGAGVPAEAESEMVWYVLGKGLTSSQHFTVAPALSLWPCQSSTQLCTHASPISSGLA